MTALFELENLFILDAAAAAPSSPQVVGRALADPGEFPYIVSLALEMPWNLVHYCDGVIYDENWIITTGECAVQSSVDIMNFQTAKVSKLYITH